MLAASALKAVGLPVARQGVIIFVAQYELLVEDACSGMNSLMGLTAVSLLYGYFARGASIANSIFMVCLAIPVAMAANVVRVALLVLVTYTFGDAVEQSFLTTPPESSCSPPRSRSSSSSTRRRILRSYGCGGPERCCAATCLSDRPVSPAAGAAFALTPRRALFPSWGRARRDQVAPRAPAGLELARCDRACAAEHRRRPRRPALRSDARADLHIRCHRQ